MFLDRETIMEFPFSEYLPIAKKQKLYVSVFLGTLVLYFMFIYAMGNLWLPMVFILASIARVYETKKRQLIVPELTWITIVWLFGAFFITVWDIAFALKRIEAGLVSGDLVLALFSVITAGYLVKMIFDPELFQFTKK